MNNSVCWHRRYLRISSHSHKYTPQYLISLLPGIAEVLLLSASVFGVKQRQSLSSLFRPICSINRWAKRPSPERGSRSQAMISLFFIIDHTNEFSLKEDCSLFLGLEPARISNDRSGQALPQGTFPASSQPQAR